MPEKKCKKEYRREIIISIFFVVNYMATQMSLPSAKKNKH